MQNTTEIKAIMRKLKDADKCSKTKNESFRSKFYESDNTETENDASEKDLMLARLEDIVSRFEKVIGAAEGDQPEDEDTADETVDETEEGTVEDEDAVDETVEDDTTEDDTTEDEDAEKEAKESYMRRLARLERRYTEQRRRNMRRGFRR